MDKKVIKLIENQLMGIVMESVKRVLHHVGHIPANHLHEVGRMGGLCIDEAVMRPIPIDSAIRHLIASYKFAVYDYYDPQRNVGIVIRDMLDNNAEVILLYVKDEKAQKQCDEIMAKTGWIASSNDLDLVDYPDLIGTQYERKKDIEATERVMQTRYIYHYCPNNKEILKSIRAKGLCPTMKSWELFGNKSKQDIENIRKPSNEHLDYSRVYFFIARPKSDFNAADYFRNKNQQIQPNDYYLLKIDTRLLPQGIHFYYDPRQEGSVFTQSNVPPQAIVNLPEDI